MYKGLCTKAWVLFQLSQLFIRLQSFLIQAEQEMGEGRF